jgi:hypothetical protein
MMGSVKEETPYDKQHEEIELGSVDADVEN